MGAGSGRFFGASFALWHDDLKSVRPRKKPALTGFSKSVAPPHGWIAACVLAFRFEIQRDPIGAIAQARWFGAVGEDMADMAVTTRASDFNAPHTKAFIHKFTDGVIIDGFEKAWPARPRFIFGRAFKQGGVAGNTVKNTVALFIEPRAGKSPLGAMLTGDLKLFWRQALPPLVIAQIPMIGWFLV